ncbi:MAG: sigma-54-dependent Fis family transcriptional regulator, partial [Algicola sp.]|nr:sigma-54-dependent Fis family transcriptional regulator [Algicola sp.]
QSRTETHRLKTSVEVLVEASGSPKQDLLGNSAAMDQVHSIIRRTAPTDANVLIIGENGTGKALVAQALHSQSLRCDNVFMSVDLGAVSETLFESELFGHKKGAFTGADKDRTGRLVAASGGTLFLDEIGNIPLQLQAKLLTVLEQRQVFPLGSNQAIDIDVRVIAATNVSRETLVDERKFRQDLLFRLNTVEITVPPLNQRPEDISQIANHYIGFYSRKYRKPPRALSEQALAAAKVYHWPGNVRALRHAIERAVILCEGNVFEAADLQLDNAMPKPPVQTLQNGQALKTAAPAPVSELPLNDLGQDLNLDRMEKRLVEMALSKHHNNISKAANELGLTRATLYRRIEKYGF